MNTRASMIAAARAAIADGRLPNEEALDVAVERMMDSGDLDLTGAAAGASPAGNDRGTLGPRDTPERDTGAGSEFQAGTHSGAEPDAPISSSDLAAFRAVHPRVPESDADRAMLAGAERVELDPEAARDGRRGRP